MECRVYADASAIGNLAAEWSALLKTARHSTIFATPEWAETWWRSFGEGRELCLIAVRDAGALVGLAPLFVEPEGGRKLIRFVGGVDVTDYEDVVARRGLEHGVWAQVMGFVNQQLWDFDLHNVPGTSPTIEFFRQLGQDGQHDVEITFEDVCPIIDPLPPDWDSYLNGLNKKDRHELRRKQRRLMSDDDVDAKLSWQPDDLELAMADFVRLHKLSSPDKEEFMTPRMVGFFNDLAQMCQQRGWLCLAFLTVQGVRVSAIMAFDYGDGLYLYNSGYDPAYEYLSAGLMLKALNIQHAIELGRKCYDFLQGSERYKYDLGGKDTEVYQISCVRK